MFKKVDKEPVITYATSALPEIFITKTALNKMNLYVSECDKEIGWLGVVESDKDTFLIRDVMLFKQEVTSTTTDIDETDLNDFANSTVEKYGSDKGVDILNSIKLWGHSHVNMSVFASGTDDESMDIFYDGGHDYFIRLIANKKGAMKIDVYNYEKGIIYENLPFTPVISKEELDLRKMLEEIEKELAILNEKELQAIEKEVKKEIKEKVKEKSNITQYANYNTYRGYSGYDYSHTYNGYSNYEKYQESKAKEEAKEETTYFVGNTELTEDVIIDLYEAYTTEDAKEILTSHGLYFNQTDEDLEEILNEIFFLGGEDYYGLT